jgi:ankyrin repeat protein
MINKRYFDFKESLNENVQQAKVYLKNLALKKKKEAAGETEGPVGLSADEVRAAETNPSFVKIKDMCRENPGYTYLFTKIFFDEYKEDTERFVDLQNLYNEIKSLGNLIKELPMPLDRYAAIKPTDDDSRPISERIQDDIEKVKLNRTFKKFYDQLYGTQKEWVDKASLQQKERLKGIGVGFSEMGKDDNGKVDEKYQKSLHRVFFSKIKDYKSLDQIIDAAVNYIKSVNNNQFSKFIKKIDEVNGKFGQQNGARIVYDQDGYLVIEVYSFIANRELNGHTSHCIARSGGYWDSYLEDYNKQYYVYNFNLDPTDPNSVIGMTIKPDGTLKAAHNRPDSSVQGKFKEMMREWKIPFELFAPMTREEIEIKKKRIEASKKIIDPNLTFEVAEKSLQDGADPNARGGLPLKNAVKTNNKELVQLLLQKGAMPNITDQNSSDTAISNAEDLEMIKILVNAGASLNSSVFRKVSSDPEAVKYLLEAGMDPSFDRSFPFRQAAKSGNVEAMDLLLKYADNIDDEKMSIAEKQLMMITERRNMALKWSAEHGKAESTIFILQKLFELGYKDLVGKPEYLKSLIDYVQNTDASKPEEKQSVIDAIREWSKDKFTEAKESKRFNNFKTFKY